MVSFRFHLVSLTAVFLALAIGIGVGATVVDRASVDFLEKRLDDVERRREATNRSNHDLKAQVSEWQRFAEQTGDQVFAANLRDIPLLSIAVEGTPVELVTSTREALAAAGAVDQGLVWLTSKLKLENDGDLGSLAEILGEPPTRPATLRSVLITRVVAQLATGVEPPLLPALRDKGFIRYEGPATESDLGVVPVPLTRFAVFSDEKASVTNNDLAIPLVASMATAAAGTVLAIEEISGSKEVGDGFVLPLRQDEDIKGRISTVDNGATYKGRTASVLALAALTRGATGNFGSGPGSERLVPEPLAS